MENIVVASFWKIYSTILPYVVFSIVLFITGYYFFAFDQPSPFTRICAIKGQEPSLYYSSLSLVLEWCQHIVGV